MLSLFGTLSFSLYLLCENLVLKLLFQGYTYSTYADWIKHLKATWMAEIKSKWECRLSNMCTNSSKIDSTRKKLVEDNLKLGVILCSSLLYEFVSLEELIHSLYPRASALNEG